MASSTTLKSIRIRTVHVPLRRPVIAGIGRFDQWPMILIDLEASSGTIGHSYLAPYRAAAVSAIVQELRELGALFSGRPIAAFDMFEGGLRALNVVGVTGISLAAIAAIDMAAWDVLAKEAGQPLAVLLGGTLGPVRGYNSNGLWRHEVSTIAAEARELVEEGGFRAMKLRLGNEHAADDIAAIEAVREGVGDKIDLMVDFNQALGLGDAIRRCHELDEMGLYWFEEPIAYGNVRGYAQLARSVRTPLQMGENFWGPRDFFTFLEAGAVHYAMGDLMRIGGVSGWLRAASIASAAGVQFSNHLYPEISAHLMRVTPTAHWLEWVDWASPILAEPTVPVAGQIHPSTAPGTGVAWNEAAVAKYLVEA
ncbi:L-alanine-DL-glutamate epimerase [Acetobacter nitrogenifigens DSM 23921 = NBRC 105050]|uniref:Mandelate racemase n=1 Tax=Acetobacter nitrogenifigens DSM 23921 = NBRC 105050 TaxID=1120919 RepID=A0A511XAD0_9PROT|nr:enolase C-terminal domain-like protein [Acetobacter nitrogenifigens]GBQ91346.1 L-alanine-DL-glutamate epimerase [Acetobacter nitrogenifigens DSM 23921 = NBRC 105050]GEN59913.1 mandelate racemase [Acetobacter nitrogenifigens DSM 23921 = NBRC 105050]